MLLTSKISNSILRYFESESLSIDDLLSATEVPPEVLSDPSSWVDAKEMEKFCYLAEAEFKRLGRQGCVVEEAGSHSKDLMAWGVLDGVLKMMERPQDVLLQPDRFLSYFVAPPPQMSEVVRHEGAIAFEISLSEREFPCVTDYLRSVFEGLPTYSGAQPASCQWKDQHVEINWVSTQKSFFQDEEMSERSLNPEFVKQLIAALEKSEQELQEKNQELVLALRRNESLEKELRDRFAQKFSASEMFRRGYVPGQFSEDLLQPLLSMQNNLVRMADYFNRAQQLVVLLVGQDRKTAQVQEAMRRVDWEYVQREFPDIFKQMCSNVQLARELIKSAPVLASTPKQGTLKPEMLKPSALFNHDSNHDA